ncbi:hypothetical protein D9M70_619280 [compost metagenome]
MLEWIVDAVQRAGHARDGRRECIEQAKRHGQYRIRRSVGPVVVAQHQQASWLQHRFAIFQQLPAPPGLVDPETQQPVRHHNIEHIAAVVLGHANGAARPMPAGLAVHRLARLDIQRMELRIQ